jgi:hypothetical protein
MQQRRSNDRPTLPPGFDVARYAKVSDAQLARAEKLAEESAQGAPAQAKRSEIRIAAHPETDREGDDVSWARTISGSPYCTMTASALQRLPLDNRAAFLLSLMDGTVEVDVLVEISSMERPEVLRILRDLYESGVVNFR